MGGGIGGLPDCATALLKNTLEGEFAAGRAYTHAVSGSTRDNIGGRSGVFSGQTGGLMIEMIHNLMGG